MFVYTDETTYVLNFPPVQKSTRIGLHARGIASPGINACVCSARRARYLPHNAAGSHANRNVCSASGPGYVAVALIARGNIVIQSHLINCGTKATL